MQFWQLDSFRCYRKISLVTKKQIIFCFILLLNSCQCVLIFIYLFLHVSLLNFMFVYTLTCCFSLDLAQQSCFTLPIMFTSRKQQQTSVHIRQSVRTWDRCKGHLIQQKSNRRDVQSHQEWVVETKMIPKHLH